MKIYTVIEERLTVFEASGSQLYSGLPERHPVLWATSIPNSEDGLALYNPYPGARQDYQSGSFQNLVRVSADGKVLWRADLPSSGNRYVSAMLTFDGLKASALSYDVQLDMATGRIIKQVFTK